MALRLRVVSEHSNRLGQQATKIFGVHGGTIGRSNDNEWILPDPERYLSGKHARIDFRAGNYVLVDTSSNGTYVNGAQVPLGKYHDYLLRDGDYVRIGEYELLVSIDKSNDFPPDDSAIVAYDGKAASASIKKSTANDLGADLDLSSLLESSDMLTSTPAPATSDSGVRPHDAYGQSLNAAAAENAPEATPWHMLTRPLKVEGKTAEAAAAAVPTLTPAPIQPPPRQDLSVSGSAHLNSFSGPPLLNRGNEAELDAGLATFCRGAGIDVRGLNGEARNQALLLAGQLLRETILGIMDLNSSRNEFRNRFRIPAMPAEAPESPLNFSRGVDEALIRLLTNFSTRAGSVEAIRTTFRELKAHSTASMVAQRAAFEEFLNRVDPKELEERFERATKRGVFGSNNKARYWELFQEMFPGVAQRPADGFPHLYVEAFAKAFEAKLRTLVPPRRAAFGDSQEPAVGDGTTGN